MTTKKRQTTRNNTSTSGNTNAIKKKKTENIPLILNNKQIAESLYAKKINIRCKNEKQKELVRSIDKNEIVLISGPAGTGKSHISLAKALELLADPNNNYQKIFLVTPNVEADGSYLGFMPGDLILKLSYYLFPTYYLIDKIIGKEARKKLQELDIITPLAIGFLRGINIENSILVCQESQNILPSQMLTILTRIGFNSKFLISGDLEQVDIKLKESGLEDANKRLLNMNEVGIIKFGREDIVRNPIIGNILERYQ